MSAGPGLRFVPTAAVVGLVVALLSPGALGQRADDVLRRDLIAQAEAARDVGNHAGAVDLAERAAALRMSPSLALMLAQEHATLDHAAVALGHARRCVTDATADAALRNRERILRLCGDLTRDMEGRVAGLSAAPPATALRGPVPPSPTIPRRPVDDHHDDARRPHPRPSSVGAGPWVVAGVGAVVLGTAGILWAMHGGAVDDRNAACDASGCDRSAIDANDRAHTLTTATNISLALGGASLAAGVAWFLIARAVGTSDDEVHAVTPSAWATPTGAGLGIGGTL